MRNKIWYSLFGLTVIAMLISCTLYLDDDEIASVDRSDNKGYVDAQTVETENGTVKYKYAKNTIAIDDEVESYIPVPVESHAIFYFNDAKQLERTPGSKVSFTCRNKSIYAFNGRVSAVTTLPSGAHAIDCVLDSVAVKSGIFDNDADSLATYSIVWFMEDTPEELLPEVGEVLVCSYREKFPDAFCHKVIDRTLQNGLYRCVCSTVSFDVAFDYFEADMEVPITAHPGDSTVDAAEYLEDFHPDLTEDGEDASRPDFTDYNPTRGWFDGWETTIGSGKLVWCGRDETTITATLLKIASGSITFGGGVYAGPKFHIKWKVGAEEHTKLSVEMVAGFKAKLMAKLQLGGDFDLPISIPILGEKIDFYVVGAEAGLYATPYVHYSKAIDGGFEFNYNVSLEFGYEGYKDKEGDVFAKATTSKKKGEEPLKINYSNDGVTQTIQAGFKFEAGVGIKPGIALAAGVKAYAEFEQSLEWTGDKLKVDAMKNKSMPITFKTVPYAKADADLIFISVSGEITGDPIFGEGKFHIQMYPDVDKRHFYRTYMNPPEYNMGFTLSAWGLLGTLTATNPKMRVLDSSRKEVASFKLKKKKDTDGEFYLTNEKSWNIKENTDYTVQCCMESILGYDIELDEFPLRVHSSEVRIAGVWQMQSNKGAFKKMVWGQEKTFKYRYRVRCFLFIMDIRPVRKWLVHAYDIKCSISEDQECDKVDKDQPTVDFYIYTNKSKDVKVYFEPSLYLKDDDGNPIGGAVSFAQFAESVTLSYVPQMEELDPGWGEPDVEPKE